MYCNKCGQEIAKDTNYCFSCGQEINYRFDSKEKKNKPLTIFLSSISLICAFIPFSKIILIIGFLCGGCALYLLFFFKKEI